MGVAVESSTKATLKKNMGIWALAGSGILCMFPLAPTQTYAGAQLASGGMAALVYLIGLCAMLFTGLSYKFMSAEFPIAGSAYTYVQRAMHHYIGFIAGWIIILDYTIVPGLLVKFSTTWLSGITDAVPTWVTITVFLAICATVGYLGNTANKWVNTFFIVGQGAFILTFVAFVIRFAIINGNGAGEFNLTPFYNPDTFDWATLATASQIGILGFIGADTIANLSEEAKHAVKNVGRAILISIFTIGIIFIGLGYMASIAHPNYQDLDPDMGLFDIAREVGGDGFYYMTVIGCVVFVGIANVIPPLVSVARVYFAMGRDGTLPFSGFFSKIHSKYRTPSNAILFCTGLSWIVTMVVDLGTLAGLVNFGAMSTYLLLNLTVIYYFLIKKKKTGVWSYIKYGLCPLIGSSVILFIFTGFELLTYQVGITWIVIGIVILVARRKHFKTTPMVIEE